MDGIVTGGLREPQHTAYVKPAAPAPALLSCSGISGGQKRRLTCGELLVGGRELLLLDEISTGERCLVALLIEVKAGWLCVWME